jgi:6-phosphogluconolactonase/glucosamine-6-phosphate isomerase/deaminase
MPDPYELMPEPLRPELPGKVRVLSTADDAIDAVAADLLVHAKNCVRSFGDFHAALSGARPLEAVYRRLMYDPGLRDLPWKQTHLWMAEEERTSAVLPRFRVVADWLQEHSDIPEEQVHAIEVGTSGFADAYRRQLEAALAFRGNGHDRLDFVLVAVEPGGFAFVKSRPAEAATLLNEVELPEGPRVVLSRQALAASRFIGVVAFGRESGDVLRRERREDIEALLPLAGDLHWYLDDEAAKACLEDGSHENGSDS